MTSLNEHIKQHPNDYQAVIALIKRNSEEIEYKRKQKALERIKLYKKMKGVCNE